MENENGLTIRPTVRTVISIQHLVSSDADPSTRISVIADKLLTLFFVFNHVTILTTAALATLGHCAPHRVRRRTIRNHAALVMSRCLLQHVID